MPPDEVKHGKMAVTGECPVLGVGVTVEHVPAMGSVELSHPEVPRKGDEVVATSYRDKSPKKKQINLLLNFCFVFKWEKTKTP
jgi:hypothetical protein